MRKLFAFVLLLLSLAVSAQTDKTFMSVNWDKIKAEVNANPQHVQQLVDILINVDADTTLTAEDKILAVYGRTYLNNGRDMFMELDMLSLIHISEPTRLHKVSRMPSSA